MNSELKERLIVFSIDIIKVCRKLPTNLENQIICKQLLRSSTSIGANYLEAQKAHTRKEFFQKVSISSKEANETLYWLEILIRLGNDFKKQKEENIEIVKILSTITKRSRQMIS